VRAAQKERCPFGQRRKKEWASLVSNQGPQSYQI
jgi:hypothetical protein